MTGGRQPVQDVVSSCCRTICCNDDTIGESNSQHNGQSGQGVHQETTQVSLQLPVRKNAGVEEPVKESALREIGPILLDPQARYGIHHNPGAQGLLLQWLAQGVGLLAEACLGSPTSRDQHCAVARDTEQRRMQ